MPRITGSSRLVFKDQNKKGVTDHKKVDTLHNGLSLLSERALPGAPLKTV